MMRQRILGMAITLAVLGAADGWTEQQTGLKTRAPA